MRRGPSRRAFLRAGAAASAAPYIAGVSPFPGDRVRKLQVEETAGLRRFGYPVSLELPVGLPGFDFPIKDSYRLSTDDGRVVPTQVRVVKHEFDRGERVALDFVVDIGPLEKRRYVLTHGPDAEPGPEPKTGLKLERASGRFRVSNGPVLHFDVPETLDGLLGSVGGGALEYLGKGSTGLTVTGRDGRTVPIARAAPPPTWEVTREGPLAVGLAAGSRATLPDGSPLPFTVRLVFPSSKSWVHVEFRVDALVVTPGQVRELGVDLNLAIEGKETLVDLGAGGTVYTALGEGERVELAGGPMLDRRRQVEPGGWAVRRGKGETLDLFARPPRGGVAEGWAHVMDAKRCTALAVYGWGQWNRDRIEITSGGRLRHSREYSPDRDRAGYLGFWLHFVPMPVQVGAVTSPQAMQSPLSVSWLAEDS